MKETIIRATGKTVPLRYVVVSLREAMDEIGARHGAEGWMLERMSECAVASFFLSSSLKCAGALSLITYWDGEVSRIESDTTPMGLVRARAIHDEVLALGPRVPEATPVRMETRRFDEKGKILAHSVVNMGDASIARNLAVYLFQSEQVKAAVGVQAVADPENPARLKMAAGWMIEAFPDCDAASLAKAEEVARNLPPLETFLTPEGFDEHALLSALAGDVDVQIHREIDPKPFCPCSRERMRNNVIALGKKQLLALRDEQHGAQAVCEFCRTEYDFTEADLDEMIKGLGK